MKTDLNVVTETWQQHERYIIEIVSRWCSPCLFGYLLNHRRKKSLTAAPKNEVTWKTFTNMALNDYHMTEDSFASTFTHTSIHLMKQFGMMNDHKILTEREDKTAVVQLSLSQQRPYNSSPDFRVDFKLPLNLRAYL